MSRPPRVPRRNPEAGASAYTNGWWWEEQPGGPRFVRGTRYAKDGVFTSARPDGDVRMVDLEGRWIIPPLAEGHNHFLEGPWALGHMNELLSQGVFYYKNPSSVGPVVRAHAALFNRPGAIDAVWSHGSLTSAGSHPTQLYARLSGIYGIAPDDLDGKAYFLVPDIAALERRWPEILDGAPDFIKLIFDDAKGELGDRPHGTPPDVAARTVALAHAAGLSVTAHVVTAADMRVALDAGVDEITHLPGWSWENYGEEYFTIDPELAADLALRNVAVVATASIAAETDGRWRQAGWTPTALQALQAHNLQTLRAAGVRIAIGSDQLRPIRDEVDYLRLLGVQSDAAWLAAWIRTGPDTVFPQRAIGRLLPGYEASFLALACDPLTDFDCIAQIGHREKQGQELVVAAAS
ncbi:hypothetical protein E2E27_02490 [Porphyrobacter sp. YT40]|nr:hypothetical protein E2E27_02490 [Porphyrobacter sp. YT40]